MNSHVIVSTVSFITFLTLKTNDNAMSTASLLVEINPKVKDRLDHLKLHPAESYSDVIDRLASFALDEETLDSETEEKIAEALKDLKEGRFFTSQEVMKMLESS
jgi:predicted transcriptional regulator